MSKLFDTITLIICCLFLAANVVLLTVLLLRRPNLHTWLIFTGAICIGWLLVGGLLALNQSRR